MRVVGVLVGLGLPLALSGCTGLTPVYGENGLGGERVELSYAAPTNRLEQIIYQDLALRLGKAAFGDNAPVLTVNTSQSSSELTNNTITKPHVERQMLVSASITLVDTDGKTVFSGSRSATADYTTATSALADQRAAEDAARRAAKLLADTIRLTVLGALMR
jgi:hypothetical protein